jgi:hypothetical protein
METSKSQRLQWSIHPLAASSEKSRASGVHRLRFDGGLLHASKTTFRADRHEFQDRLDILERLKLSEPVQIPGTIKLIQEQWRISCAVSPPVIGWVMIHRLNSKNTECHDHTETAICLVPYSYRSIIDACKDLYTDASYN